MTSALHPQRIFNPGRTYITPAALALLEPIPGGALRLVHRHTTGDFGNISPDDAQLNYSAIAEAAGDRIMSSYTIADSAVWVITEAADEDGNPATTILLPSDY